MEELFEFLFSANGRIHRAKCWLSLLKYSIAGLLAAVILFTAAGIAAPLFIIMVVLVFIPWLMMWGFAITTERLHDREERMVAIGVLWGAGGARPACKSCMVSGSGRHGAALHPGTGRICTHDLGIYRNRLPARPLNSACASLPLAPTAAR
jgi:hypothetical protein